MLVRLKSKRGYIFTYEAVIVAAVFVIVFYLGYFAISHNILTVHEEKRNIESFEKANLITDVLYKQHELPSNSYIPDYKRFLDKIKERYYISYNKIPGTFDPSAQVGLNYVYNDSWMYIINISNPNDYNLTDYQVLVTLTPTNFNFDFSPNGKNISFWENDSGTITEIPYWIETWKYNQKARIWIKVNKIPKNSSILVYLKRNQNGDSSIEDDGNKVFIFFDDFENESLWDKWKVVIGSENDWNITQDNTLPYYNNNSGENHVAHLKPSSVRYRSIISRNPLNVNDGDKYILEATVKGHTGAEGGSADSPDTMVGFYSDSNANNFYNSFTGYDQLFAICRNYDTLVKDSNIFTKDNTWYEEKFILEQKNNQGDRICNSSIWEFFNGYYGDPNPNNNTNTMFNVNCKVTKKNNPKNSRYILLGTGQGTHDEEYWFDNIKVRKYAPKVSVSVSENIVSSTILQSIKSYYFTNIPNVISNVNLIFVNYSVNYSENTYIKKRNLLVPIKTWRYSNNKIISENISKNEILYFAARRPSTLVYINASSTEATDAIFLVNGVPFELHLNSTPKITGFGKVINTHNWEYYEPNEIKLLNVSNNPNQNITLNITFSQPSTIYVLKLRPENISCVVELKN
ncbi:DUF2341 domain-containing protein [Methanothermococcus sp.]|uniref:DUF2341 domain-containing protein n=1 Tax=Methanothermococcus sp. TaxID=2614238 RepID=UPI0025D7CA2D|nr:DUF2341 domain-containing protein [Methanothermococcus sp.]